MLRNFWRSLFPQNIRTGSNRRRRSSHAGPTASHVARAVASRDLRQGIESLESRQLLTVITVTSLADTIANDGQVTLREAIQAANTDTTVDGVTGNGADTIQFDPSLTASGPAVITLGGTQLAITSDMNILGPGADRLTIDGNRASGIFKVDDSNPSLSSLKTVTISGLTLTGGQNKIGGAIDSAENLTVLDSLITGNTAQQIGGGIASRIGTLTVKNSTISNNSAGDGGAIKNDNGTLTVVQSVITGNTAYRGGGIYCRYATGTTTISQSTISGNVARNFGGGLASYTQYYQLGSVAIEQSTISMNSAWEGGGIAIYRANLSISQSTIAGNTATVNGGGIRNHEFAAFTLNNSIIAGNTVNGQANDLAGLGAPASASANNLIGAPGGDLSSVLFPAPVSFNGALPIAPLVAGSPALNAGNNALIPADTFDRDGDGNTTEAVPFDERGAGFDRVLDGTVDLGAAEGVPGFVGVMVQATSPRMAEDGSGLLTFEIQRSNGVGSLTVNFAVGGTAILNEDYTTSGFSGSSGSVTFADGSMTTTITVDPTADSVFENNDTIILTLTSGEGYEISLINTATATIVNDESIVVDTLDDENDGNRTPGNWSLREALDLANSNIGPDTIVFVPSLTASGPATIRLTLGELKISDDLVIQGPETNGITINAEDRSNIFNVNSSAPGLRDVSLRNLTLTGANGPAISSDDNLTIFSCTITGNRSPSGAIQNFREQMTVIQSTISGNTSTGDGGAFRNDGQLTIIQSTITGNSAVKGGGIFNVTANSLLLNNSIVAGNTKAGGLPSDIEVRNNNNVLSSSKNNLIGNAGTAGGLTNGTNGNVVGVAVTAVLNPTLADNGGPTKTLTLISGSPAINAGDNGSMPADTLDLDGDGDKTETAPFDQRGTGFARVTGGTVDIGAVEFAPGVASASITATSAANSEGSSGSTPFTFTVTRTGDTSGTASVDFAVTGSGSNPADATDFGGTWPSGTVSFAANEVSKTLTINVSGDRDVGPDEGFTVTLSSPSGFALGTASATGTIRNDDVARVPAAGDVIEIGQNSTSPDNLVNVNGRLFFVASDDSHGRELWTTDGTLAGTVLVKDIQSGSASGAVSGSRTAVAIGSTLFFVANDGVNGAELWKSDGTAAGTVLVADVNAGASSSSPQQLTNVDGTLFFTADNGINGRELWKSDGTAAGTVLVKDISIASAASSDPTELVNVAGVLFFTATDGTQGRELWKSDGTASGTVLVKDIRSGSLDSAPQFLTNVNGRLFFSATDGAVGRELWKSDGTDAGTVLIKDIRSGSSDSAPQQLANADGVLYFSATDGTNGRELWKSDGTSSGTVLVKNLNSGSANSNPADMTLVGSTILFSANDGVNGRELWKTDGTDAGTSLVKDIFAGADHANPQSLLNINGRLWFTVVDGTHGRELWTSDGTAANTRLIQDLSPGIGNSDPSELTVTDANGMLFFSADDGVLGRQLWNLDSSHVVVEIPTLSLTTANTSSLEGNSGNTAFTFTVTRTGDTSRVSSANFAVTGSGANAANASDFGGTLPSGTISFAAGETSKTLTINVSGDTAIEPDEGFTVTLSNAAGANLETSSATGTILNDDVSLSIAATDASKSEGNSGNTAFTFTVTRTGNTSGSASANFSVTGSGANAANAADFGVGSNSNLVLNGDFEAGNSGFSTAYTLRTSDVGPAGTYAITSDPRLVHDQFGSYADHTPGSGSQMMVVNGTTTSATVWEQTVAVIPNTVYQFAAFGSSAYATPPATLRFEINGTSVGTLNLPAVTGQWTPFSIHWNSGSATSANLKIINTSVDSNGNDFALDDISFAVAASLPNGTINFAAGETTKTIIIDVTGDGDDEPNENFTVTLSNVVGASLGTSSGIGTILNDDSPTVSIMAAHASRLEGNSGSTPFTFTVTRTSGVGTASVNYAVTGSGSNAANSTDFGGSFPSGTISFAAGETTKTLTINVNGDSSVESDEGFTVTLSNAIGATLGTSTATGTIESDDASLAISTLNSSQSEGNSGSTPFTFNVTRTGGTSGTAGVNYAVSANGSNPANAADFGGSFPIGTVNFAAGETVKTITINVSGDTVYEENEGFKVTLSNAVGATISSSSKTGTISNDDAGVLIQANAVSKSEGQSGQTTFRFLVTRQGSSSGTSTVDYVVSGSGSNPADANDFGGSFASGTVTFEPSQVTQEINVLVVGDTQAELDESFKVTLSNAVGATLLNSVGNGTIVDDDSMISFTTLDASRPEGHTGNTPFTFTLSRVDASNPASVDFAVSGYGFPAANATDFGGSFPTGTISFGVGETSQTLTVNVSGDTLVEGDDVFQVQLSNPVGGRLGTAFVTSRIFNDDASLSIAATDATKNEGNSGTTPFTFTVTRTGDTSGASSVEFAVAGSGTNPANADDFSGMLPSGTVNFAAGQTTQTITIQVSADTVAEPDEGFSVSLANPLGATVLTSSATGTIRNDEASISIAASSASQFEGSNGTTAFTFTVTRNVNTSGTASVDFAVTGSGANAADALDFGGTLPSGTINFAAGESSKTITLNVSGDTTTEPDEGFTVTLSNAVATVLAASTATGTIRDDDGLLSITATDASKPEGQSGTTPFVFTVSRPDGSFPASVNFAVTGTGSSADAADFGGTFPSGTLNFAVGETTQTLVISVTGDMTLESDEGFTVTLSNPIGGGLATATATGTIRDDDDIFVVDSLIDENDGNISAGNFSLREAIVRANSKAGTQTIVFAPSLTTSGPATITLGGTQLAITSDLNIVGPGAGLLTINANQRSRVLEVDDKTSAVKVVAISGLTLTGAKSSGTFREGGGLFNRESLTITDSVITGNVAESDGGGIYNLGTLDIARSTISNNTAAHPGGGIASWGSGSVTVNQSNVSGNTSGAEGGGLSGSSPLNVIQSTISGNAARNGGGISSSGVITVTQSTISDNRATNIGGGIDSRGVTTVTQSTISGNQATRFGGGILSTKNLTVQQSTIVQNTAERGGGLFKDNTNEMTLVNSIVAGNRNTIGEFSDLEGNSLVDPASHHNLIGDPRTASGLTHGVNGNIVGAAHAAGGPVAIDLATVLDPVLSDNGGTTKTHALVNGGLAVDAGDNGSTGGAAFDQRGSGFARVSGDRVDLGAVEIGSLDLSLPQVTITSSTGAVAEDAATLMVFTFARENTTGPLTVNFRRGGTASADEDYSSSASGAVTFADGESTVTVTVSPIADDKVEGNETVFFTIMAGPGYRLGEANAAIATILNDDRFVVDTLADESDGDFGPGNLSLREAIEQANLLNGDKVIAFAPSLTASGPATITLSGKQLAITKSVTIQGPGADRLTIDANHRSRVLQVDDGSSAVMQTVLISGLTLTGANSSGMFREGGGVFNFENLTILDSIVTGNVSESDGGGIYNLGNLNVVKSTISNNRGNDPGGGISSHGGTVNVLQSTISGNWSQDNGGGIFGYGGLNIVQSTISGNSTDSSGAGIAANSGTTTITQSTITGNTARNNGGGIFSYEQLIVRQSTISGNTAGRGGGIYSYGYSGGSGKSASLTNSLVVGNKKTDGTFSDIEGQTLLEPTSSHNLVGSPTRAGGLTHGMNGNLVGADNGAGGRTVLDSATVLEPTLANNGGPTQTLALVGGSPAVNAGDNAAIPVDAFDLDADSDLSEPLPFDARGSGFARVNEGQVDIGAFELAVNSPALPTVNVSAIPASILEDAAGTLVFTFTRNLTSGPLTANFSLTGTATLDNDYSASASGSVTFADGESSASITIDPTSDIDVEANETIVATVISGTGYYLGGLSPSATTTIVNDDASLSVSTSPFKAEGNSGNTPVTFTITRKGSTTGTATIDYSVAGSGLAAAVASDIGGTFPSGTISFAAGQSTKTIIINVSGDTAIEADEGLTMSLSNATGAVLEAASATVTILNDDGPTTNTYVVDTLVDELDNDADSGDFSLREAIERANAMPGTQTITFASSLTANGPAKIMLGGTELTIKSDLNIVGPGADQLAIDGQQLSRIFNVNDGNSSTKNTVVISGLTMTNGKGSSGGGIQNVENLTLLQSVVSRNTVSVGSVGGGILNSSQGILVVDQSSIVENGAPGGGNGGGIYSSNSTLTILRSNISGNVGGSGGGISSYQGVGALTIANSTISENTSSGSGGGIRIVGPSSGSQAVVITQSTISGNAASENGGGLVANSSSSLSISQSTIISNTTGGSGGGVSSNVATTTLTNTIVAGNRRTDDTADDLGNGGTLSANSKNNLIGDPSRSAGLINGVNGNIVGQASGSGRSVVNLASVLNPMLADNGGPTKTHALVSGSPAINAGINSAIPADSNDLDGDGNLIESLPFDQRGSGFARMFGSTVDLGAVEFAPTAVTVAVAPASVTEDGASQLAFTLTRDLTIGPLTVSFSLSGTATAGEDYLADATNSVTFADGASTARVTVDSMADTVFEPAETVILTLLSGVGYHVGSTNLATGTILNDDVAAPTLSIAVLEATKPEGHSGNTEFTFTVIRTGDASSPASVEFAVSGSGSNRADAADFGGTLPSGTINFAAGESSQVLTINVSGDDAIESDEGFTVTLANEMGVSLGNATATGTIVSDDASLSIATASAWNYEGHGGGTAYTFTVTRTGSASGEASVDFVVSGSGANAADAADFGGVWPSGSVNFAAGQTSKTITVNVHGDMSIESDEGFTVTLANATGANLESNSATGTIRNDDRPALRVAVDASGNLTLTEIGYGQSDEITVTFDSASQEYVISSPIAESLTADGVTFTNSVRVAAARVTRGLLADLGGGDDRLDLATLKLPATVQGGAGNDTIKGGSARNVINGGDGNDLLLGGMESDTLSGGAGDDSLLGGGQADSLSGGDGNDVVDGQGGSGDIVDGGAGDDTLEGGAGLDIIRGGEGLDTYIERQDAANKRLSITLTNSQVSGLEPHGVEILSGVELAVIEGGSNSDRIDASAFSGSVTLFGGRGDDILIGGNNNDVLHGEEGSDSLEGRLGHDYLTGGDGDDRLQGGGGDDTLDAGDGDDKLLGNSGDDVMRGGAGNDFLTGHAGSDTLLGGDGNDTLLGGEDIDWLLGEAGQDLLKGDADSDRLAGGGNNIAAELGDRIVGEAAEFDELIGFNFNKRVRKT